MENPNLKPCPFCGSKPFLNGRGPTVNGKMLWQVGCDNESCPVHDVWGAGYVSDKKATEAWNTRSEINRNKNIHNYRTCGNTDHKYNARYCYMCGGWLK